jgi:hypothetical protein
VKKLPLVALLTIVSLALLCGVASADPDPNTYTLTKTSPPNPAPSDTVLMTAATSNTAVNKVVFKWYAPGVDLDGTPTYTSPDTTPADGYTSTYIVTSEGDWTVTATFSNSAGTPIWVDTNTHTATKFVIVGVVFPVPEYCLGALLALSACAAAFVSFKYLRAKPAF